MYYAKSTGGFYTPAINGKNIPDDAIEITEDEYLGLLQAQADGKIITSDDKGNPVAIDPPPLTQEELVAQAEREKASLLKQATNSIAPLQDASDLGIATDEEIKQLTDLKKYRVQLMRVDTSKAPAFEWPTYPAD
ncbi:tail fiber assembly protein [Enterobacter asburiae]|uniref:tail fiber assembly protein n=1 Tax=Enterobacter asburiae TaxID=61645 RepID=UPI00066897B6|nr:tail fiber assembly protein [Enterobacter asburiae]